jgi:hypothetical protein
MGNLHREAIQVQKKPTTVGTSSVNWFATVVNSDRFKIQCYTVPPCNSLYYSEEIRASAARMHL